MRPEGGSVEALHAWNAHCVAEMFARLERTSTAKPTDQTTLPENDDPTEVLAVAAVPAEVTPPESVPRPDLGSDHAASASSTPDPQPSEAAQPVAPEAPLRLPYPFNLMNPADVPEEVWQQARAAQKRPL
jgi:hypothetical protein